MQQNIHASNCQIEELKATDIYNFKIRVDESLADGIDLLAEMAAALDLDIIKAKNRLAVLRGDEAGVSDRSGTPLETRIIRFPVDMPSCTLFERSRSSVDFRDWRRIGIARGAKEVFLDKSVRLDVKSAPGTGLDFLDTLQADDLQALFLYEIDDSALHHLAHLSGLEELYLSNSTVTDGGLRLLSKLSGLKRLYIYHTAITDYGLMNLIQLTGLKSLTCSGINATDEGINRFRQLMPRCKVVSFKWRYDQ
jgi:Leucine-rich repeat (LRR) protein